MGSRAQKARLQRLRPGSPVRHGTEHTPCNPNRTDACATSQPAEYKPEGRPEYTWSRRAQGCRAVHHWLLRSLRLENTMLISATPGIYGRRSGSHDQRYWMRDVRATCGIPAGSLLAAWFGGSFLSLGVPLSRCANDLVAPLFQPVHASPTRATTTASRARLRTRIRGDPSQCSLRSGGSRAEYRRTLERQMSASPAHQPLPRPGRAG